MTHLDGISDGDDDDNAAECVLNICEHRRAALGTVNESSKGIAGLND